MGKKGDLLKPKLIIKRKDSNFTKDKRNQESVKQLKDLLEQLPDTRSVKQTSDVNKEDVINKDQLVDVKPKHRYLKGLSPKENSELSGVLNPENSIDPNSRIGDKGHLQIQADYFQEELNETIELRHRTENPEKFLELEETAIGLRNTRDRTLKQRQLEEIRAEQENDISRLQKFKEWAKENLVGVSALAISIAGIITTIIVGARKALVRGAQATGKFAKAVYDLGKKLGSFPAPLLNIISQAISWGF